MSGEPTKESDAGSTGGSGVSAAGFLLAVSLVGAALGFVQSMIVARLLGASAFGLIAILTAFSASLLNVFDVRLTDLAARLYYQPQAPGSDREAQRAGIMLWCVIGNTAIGLAAGATGAAATWWAIGWLTDQPIQWWWVVAQAGIMAATHVSNVLFFLQRFSGRFMVMGWTQLAVRVMSFALFVPVLLMLPSIGGFFVAASVASGAMLIVVAAASARIAVRYQGLSVSRDGLKRAAAAYRGNLDFAFFGNLMGYSKLLHRAADVLAVAYFADDRAVGVYRLARAATDKLYMAYDAMNQVYFTRFLELLGEGRLQRVMTMAGRITLSVGLATAAVAAVEAALLPHLIPLALGPGFEGATSAIVVLTIPVFLVTGVHLWIWPILVHRRSLRGWTLAVYVGCAVQYGLLLLFAQSTPFTAVWPAAAYGAYYLVTTVAGMALLAGHSKGTIKRGAEPSG